MTQTATDYPARIVKAYTRLTPVGLVNYWRNLWSFVVAAQTLDELKKQYEYAWRVADRDSLLWCVIEQAKLKRKWELKQGLANV